MPSTRPMRKAIYEGDADEGRAILARARDVQIAMTDDEGRPILRTFDAVVHDGVLAFHGAPAGEKMDGVGRPVVVSAHETVASIPSWFLDPDRACPATTYYLAAQAHGIARVVADPERKARLLQALMEKYQPEGKHVPLGAAHPLYRKPIAGLLVVEIPLDDVTCKTKLGQNRPDHERVRVLEHLWQRGARGDVRAVATIVRRWPELAPSFLAVPEHLRSDVASFACALDDDDIDDVASVLAGAYWLVDVPHSVVRASVADARAVAVARDAGGNVVGFARAVTDARCAWIYDVIVAPHLRGRGVGEAIVRLLLDHPDVRRVRHVRLGTRDAMRFYERFGFVPIADVRGRLTTDMIRVRSEGAAEAEAVHAVPDERQHDGARSVR